MKLSKICPAVLEKLFKAKVDDGRTDNGQRPIAIFMYHILLNDLEIRSSKQCRMICLIKVCTVCYSTNLCLQQLTLSAGVGAVKVTSYFDIGLI